MDPSRVSNLEQRYISLLESRIQDLERQLSAAPRMVGPGGPPSAMGPPQGWRPGGYLPMAPKPPQPGGGGRPRLNEGPGANSDDEPDSPDDDTLNSRYKVVINQYDSRTGERVDKPRPMPRPKPKEAQDRAFVFRKFLDSEEKISSSELIIYSEELQLLLGRVMDKYLKIAKVGKMTSPYTTLVYCWDEAERLAAEPEPEEDKGAEAEAGSTELNGEKGGGVGGNTTTNHHNAVVLIDEQKQARADLRELLSLISSSSGNEVVDHYFKEREALRKSKMITFDTLWTLFPRGTEVVGRPYEGEEQLFWVYKCPVADAVGTNETTFNIILYSYDWDGTELNRVPYEVEIEKFTDKKSINELPYYPLEYHQDRNEKRGKPTTADGEDTNNNNNHDNTAAIERLKKALEDRGREFWKNSTLKRGHQMLRYDGIGYQRHGAGTLFRPSSTAVVDDDGRSSYYDDDADSSRTHTTSKLHVRGAVVVDFRSYYEYQNSRNIEVTLGDLTSYYGMLECNCIECQSKFEDLARFSWDRQARSSKDNNNKNGGEGVAADNGNDFQPTPEQLRFLPPRVLGYALEQKRWVELNVKKLTPPPKADTTNFETKLQLHPDYKNLIRRAVEAHSKSKTHNIVDYTPEKGKGLVILLWGLPGVGKTLTAESVALLAGKPLFSVGVSDIGLDGPKVELNLQKVFDLAGLWEAVLLFDEADVFLEARDTHRSDMQRNTIVSVLLRVLEYFNGILILTTNRLKSFDIAVQSRIHIAIEYKDLTEDQRCNIFLEFLSQLQQKNLVEDWKGIQDWVQQEGRDKDFNGRQVRNVVSTAMAIANADNVGLGRSHLIEVCKHVSQFKKALHEQETLFRSTQINSRFSG